MHLVWKEGDKNYERFISQSMRDAVEFQSSKLARPGDFLLALFHHCQYARKVFSNIQPAGCHWVNSENLRIVLGIHYNEDLHPVLIFNSPGRVFHCYEVNLIPWLAIKHLCLNRGLLASCFWNNLWVSIAFWKILNFMWHMTSRSQLSLNKQADYVIKIEWSSGW